MAVVAKAADKAHQLFNERWRCGHCGREFNDATHCCTHEEQCGGMTRC